MNSLCPGCQTEAPLLYRGVEACCSACGAPRAPLSAQSLQHTGRASQIGGSIARGFGYSIIAFGSFVALLSAAALQLIWPHGFAGCLLGLPLFAISLVVGIALLRSGKSLATSGEGARRAARERAVLALAAHRGGSLTARDVARAHGVTEADADATLTELAQQSLDVNVDVDDDRGVVYRFHAGEMGPPAR